MCGIGLIQSQEPLPLPELRREGGGGSGGGKIVAHIMYKLYTLVHTQAHEHEQMHTRTEGIVYNTRVQTEPICHTAVLAHNVLPNVGHTLSIFKPSTS